MEKAFKILESSDYYKQLQKHDECFKKAKEAFSEIGERFGTKNFLSRNYVITGVEKDKIPEEFLQSLTSSDPHNPTYYNFRKNSKLAKYINSVYNKHGFVYMTNSPMYLIDFIGNLRTEKVKKGTEVYIKITYDYESLKILDNWEEIKLSEFYKIKEESEQGE